MAARPYRPSGLGDPGSTAALLLGALAVGGAAGALLGVAGRWLHLFLVFPLLLGLVVGIFSQWAVGAWRYRAPLAAALLAGSGGLAGEASVHLAEYALYRAAHGGERPGAGGARAPDADEALERETGARGLRGYLRLRAAEGTTLRWGGGTRRLAGGWTFALWGLEGLLAALAAGSLAFGRARRPFCERCRRWYEPEARVAAGSGEPDAVRAAVSALDRRDMPALAAALGTPGEETATLLALARCGRCLSHQPVVRLLRFTRLQKGARSALRYASLLRPEEAAALLEAFSSRRAPGAVTAPSGSSDRAPRRARAAAEPRAPAASR